MPSFSNSDAAKDPQYVAVKLIGQFSEIPHSTIFGAHKYMHPHTVKYSEIHQIRYLARTFGRPIYGLAHSPN